MNINGKTDIGKMRSSNQDEFVINEFDDGGVLAVVCDGMGGANAGNIASGKATESILSFVKRSYRKNMKPIGIASLLQNAILSANMELFEMSSEKEELSGMGTTVVAAFIKGSSITVAHVGDSRAYLIGKEVKLLTKDHSVVQSLVESGKLTPEEARVHPKRNIITRALGIESDVLVDCNEYEAANGEILLLCTDGLSNFVTPEEIKETLKEKPFDSAAEELIEKANKNGGADNITAVTVLI